MRTIKHNDENFTQTIKEPMLILVVKELDILEIVKILNQELGEGLYSAWVLQISTTRALCLGSFYKSD